MEMKAEREEKPLKAKAEREECLSPESRHYYLARRTLLTMLGDRGYVVPDVDAQLRPSLGDPCNMRLTAHRASDFSRKIVGIFCGAHQTRKQDAFGLLSQIVNNEMLDKVILIMQSRMSFHAQKVLDTYPVQVETLMIFDLLPRSETDDKNKPLMNKRSREVEIKAKREERSRKRAARKEQKMQKEEQERQKEVEMIRERYYCAWRFLMQMFTDRGYVVPDLKAELALSRENFHVKFGDHPEASRLSVIAHRASDPSRKIVAIFCEAYQTKREDVLCILSGTENQETLDRVILVMQCKMDVDAQKVLDEEYPVKVETFMISELQVNSLRMGGDPEYEFYSREEEEKVLKKVEEVRAMDQSLFCPKYYGLEEGQLLKASYTIGGGVYRPGMYRVEHYYRVV